jgi:hypothetical protein
MQVLVRKHAYSEHVTLPNATNMDETDSKLSEAFWRTVRGPPLVKIAESKILTKEMTSTP